VEAGREDVREHRQVADLLHGLLLVGELEQVEVGIGNHHVLGLAADPAAHIDVAVGGAGAVGIDVEADAGPALLAVLAAAAGDVEGDGDEVALLDELDVAADLDHLARDLVPEDKPCRGGRPTANHVLVAPADVRRDDLDDDAVLCLAADIGRIDSRSILEHELRKVDGLNFDLPRLDIRNSSVVGHSAPFLLA
jgi:hypothetical protein